MNARFSRVSSATVVCSASSVVVGALAIMLSGSMAFADNTPTYDADQDLPISAPTLRGPAPKAPPAPSSPVPPPTGAPPVFFGKDLANTGSVVYVIDQSGSMSLSVQPFTDSTGKIINTGNRMDRAKSELVKSIKSLPTSFTFNVIFYDECIRPWKGGNVQANDANKGEAFTYISTQQPMGFTNTGLAVATALQDKLNKSVVLLSDGEPNFLDCAANYIGTYDEHKALIHGANTQTARIDCFGIGVTGDQDARNFMMQVASQNGGTYVEVN
jgi:hypothetical protein